MNLEPSRDVLPELEIRHPEDPPWTGWDVVLIGVVSLLAMLITTVIGMGVMTAAGVLKHGSPKLLDSDARIIIPVQLAAYVVTFFVMYSLVTRRYGRPFWTTVRWQAPVRWGGLIATGVCTALTIQIAGKFLPIPKSLPIETFFRNPASAYLMGIFGITAAPFVEELFFRGFLYPVAARRMGLAMGVVFTSGAFALIHQAQLAHAWAPLALLFCVGLVLTTTRARTGSVAASFIVHVSYNFTLFFMLWVATGGFRHLERLAE